MFFFSLQASSPKYVLVLHIESNSPMTSILINRGQCCCLLCMWLRAPGCMYMRICVSSVGGCGADILNIFRACLPTNISTGKWFVTDLLKMLTRIHVFACTVKLFWFNTCYHAKKKQTHVLSIRGPMRSWTPPFFLLQIFMLDQSLHQTKLWIPELVKSTLKKCP